MTTLPHCFIQKNGQGGQNNREGLKFSGGGGGGVRCRVQSVGPPKPSEIASGAFSDYLWFFKSHDEMTIFLVLQGT